MNAERKLRWSGVAFDVQVKKGCRLFKSSTRASYRHFTRLALGCVDQAPTALVSPRSSSAVAIAILQLRKPAFLCFPVPIQCCGLHNYCLEPHLPRESNSTHHALLFGPCLIEFFP
ncbi:hypothetical protein CY34DRAFT_814546 [Suillus luteus UH-Slu-Lm8-n1]|uniref:Unplaced genomic scaffold CY34scaffold_1595, whole genome shotgun sequence n=1 Tax=Suillus luteus UH-Slu-Lm8-n1 TaxID=930992 RepID=A0A0D0A0J5_9AGAM|nr:hypothetical protein CY34DRAFT_814546 [Suillus luteus UH-Slu-Lm8-n1]